MKWFVTEEHNGIRKALIDSGEEVVGGEALRDRSTIEESRDYKLKAIIRNIEAFDVLVLGHLVENPGYWKGAVLPWSGAIKGRCVVGVLDGQESLLAAKTALRGCSMNVNHCGVLVSRDLETAEALTRYAKSVYWDGGNIRQVIAAASDYCNYIHELPRLYR